MNIQIRRASVVTLYLILIIVLPVMLTLHSVVETYKIQTLSENPTPLGYTISLSLFVFPMFVLGWWFFRKQQMGMQKKAFLWTITLLIPLGVLLDVFFGNMFFEFGNHNAVTGITFPAIGGALPIEEVIFYVTGFVTILLLYIWCDEYWLERYNLSDYESEVEGISRLIQFHLPSLLIGLGLIVISIIYKKYLSGDEGGFPWYFIYITIVALIPSMMLFPSTQRFINWRAFSFTFFVIVLISLIWEATLALPYQWWGYQDSAMMGIHIRAWHNLPVEAVIIWFAVSYTTVIIYETIKIWKASKKEGLKIFVGTI